jgi:GAF domain-containing protein
VAEPEGEGPQTGVQATTAHRMEERATWVAILWVSALAILDAVYNGRFGLIGLLLIGPFIAAASASSRRTALVSLYAIFFAVILSTPPRDYGELNHVLRVLTAVASGGVAVWLAHLRTQRTQQLWSARTETRNERRRRVAAETAQRMQAMARALTTAADPAQVADAVFDALRAELRVDAASFATTNERGVLTVHRRFGYGADEPDDAVLSAMEPDGAMADVLQRQVALFAESIGALRRDWPLIASSLPPTRFNSLAVAPLIVSDRAVGVVVVHWVKPRTISEADKTFLFTITGAAAQAVERARLTMTDFTNLERSQHLHHLSSALAVATTPGDVARAAIAGGRRALGAQSAACRVPAAGERSLTCLASSGHPSLLSRGDVPVDSTPSGAAFTRGHRSVTTLGATEELNAEVAFELVARVLAELNEPVTIVSEPLLGSVGPLGTLTFAFVASSEPSEPELHFLSTLAALTSQALERAQLFEQERQALRDAESGRERLSLLSEVTALLSSSLDPTTVMHRTMSLVVGRLADACVVQVPDETGLRRLDMRGTGVFASETALRLVRPEVIPFDCDAPGAIAFRTGRAQMAAIPTPPLDDATTGDSMALAVPMTANGTVIGVMTFIDGPGHVFEPDDVSLATEVASRTGVALSNATRFQREHDVAEVLQRAVLPDFLPTVKGLQFDAEYRPGAAGTYVGGDWYDVFQLDDEQVVFSVGDVMGKGASAAALMGQVRSAIRAYAVAGHSPSEILSALDRLFDALVEDRVVTVVVGIVDPTSGIVQLANAGHPPPLLVTADGTATFTTAPSSLLITAGLGGAPRPAELLHLAPADTLVIYSDGLVERRGESIATGMERLATEATAVASSGWPDQPAVALATLLSDDESTDDIVVLAVHFVGDTANGVAAHSLGTGRDGMSTLRLEPAVESTPTARHWVRAHLRNIPPDVAECAALLTSELVTNAVLHADTPLCVTLHNLSDRIRVDVADGSAVLPSVKDYGVEAATGRGLTLFDTLASAWGVQLVPGGKIVWFELPVDYSAVPEAISDGNFRFDLAGFAHSDLHDAVLPSAHVSVDLLGIPVGLLQKASEEYEALFREIRLIKERSGTSSRTSPLPERLSVLVSEIGTRFSGFGPGMDEMWQDVVDHAQSSYDWHLSLPQSAVVACEFYDAMLDEADEFGLSAQLLTLPASPTSVAVRRWFLSELIGQLHGRAPTPWLESRYQTDLMHGIDAG